MMWNFFVDMCTSVCCIHAQFALQLSFKVDIWSFDTSAGVLDLDCL